MSAIHDVITATLESYISDDRISSIKKIRDGFYTLQLKKNSLQTDLNTETIYRVYQEEFGELMRIDQIITHTQKFIHEVVDHLDQSNKFWKLLKQKKFTEMNGLGMELSLVCYSPQSCIGDEWESIKQVCIRKKNVYGFFIMGQIIGSRNYCKALTIEDLDVNGVSIEHLAQAYIKFLFHREFEFGVIIDTFVEKNDSIYLTGKNIVELSMTMMGLSALIQTLHEEFELAFGSDKTVLVLRINADTIEIMKDTPEHIKHAKIMAQSEKSDRMLGELQPDVEYFFDKPIIERLRVVKTKKKLHIFLTSLTSRVQID